jgi:uncharacterized protein YjiS (DUF1127 family)
MTTATIASLTSFPARAARPVGLIQLIGDILEGVREGSAMASRYDRLSRMSSQQLADIGLTRFDIPQAVVNGTAAR